MTKQILKRPEEIKQVIQLSVGRQLPLSRPLVMGILNVTPDSFSDGNQYLGITKAINQAQQLEADGADLIDIGGESSRPGAKPISVDDEIERVIPVIKAIRKESKIPISIDTYKSETAAAALDAGADIVNDISALRFDLQMADLVAERKVPLIMMHMQGTPRGMQKNPTYTDCVSEIYEFFKDRIGYCSTNGIDRSKLILDPGIGFGKRLSDNLEIFQNLHILKELSLPILVGASRKSFISMIQPTDKPANERLGGSIAAAIMSVLKGANIIRVHDVEQTVEALKVVQAIKDTK